MRPTVKPTPDWNCRLPVGLHDAMDKVQLQENEELYLEVDDYYDFEYLAPHLDGAETSA